VMIIWLKNSTGLSMATRCTVFHRHLGDDYSKHDKTCADVRNGAESKASVKAPGPIIGDNLPITQQKRLGTQAT
jgi:hypothetical protein